MYGQTGAGAVLGVAGAGAVWLCRRMSGRVQRERRGESGGRRAANMQVIGRSLTPSGLPTLHSEIYQVPCNGHAPWTEVGGYSGAFGTRSANYNQNYLPPALVPFIGQRVNFTFNFNFILPQLEIGRGITADNTTRAEKMR